MHFNTLAQLREQMYGGFERSRAALFHVSDARLSESQARSLPEWSLSVFFERRWPSVYQALQDGHLTVERLREVFVQAWLETPPTDEPIGLGLDSSRRHRLEAESRRDRGMISVPNLPPASKPVSAGWPFSPLMLLPAQPRSWVGIGAQRRRSSEPTAIEVGSEQRRAGVPQVRGRPLILLADRGYATASLVHACHERGCQALSRLKRQRTLYRAAPPRKEKPRGAPCKPGALFPGTGPETYGPVHAPWEGVDEHGKRVVVSCWTGLHFRAAPEVEVSVIRVLREAARESKRDPRERGFIGTGTQDIPLEQGRTWYRKRFSPAHGYRFLKQDLLWTQAPLRTPQPRGTREVDGGVCLQSSAAGPTTWPGGPASRGKHPARAHPATGASGDAQHVVAGWHTRSATQTAWSIAGMAQRPGQNTRTTLCRGAQTQTAAQTAAQTGLMASKAISVVIPSDFSKGVG
jgi:hypothetical protein